MVQSGAEQVFLDELWMSVDIKHALRHVLCLTNPSRMQAARWGEASVGMSHALRHGECLPNPSELRPQEVPVGQGGEVGRRVISVSILNKH